MGSRASTACRCRKSAATIRNRRARERLERDLRNLGHLRAFALPIVDRLARVAGVRHWGEWLDRFDGARADRSCGSPSACSRVLAAAAADERRSAASRSTRREAVVADRLLSLEVEPPRTRYGRVFVGGPRHGARTRLPRRLRGGTRRAAVPAAPARGSDAAGRRDARCRSTPGWPCRRTAAGTSGCCCGSRWAPRPNACGSRIRGLEIARIASAGAELLRARRDARNHRADSAPRSAAGAGGRGGGAGLAWPAPDEPEARHRRHGARPRRAAS